MSETIWWYHLHCTKWRPTRAAATAKSLGTQQQQQQPTPSRGVDTAFPSGIPRVPIPNRKGNKELTGRCGDPTQLPCIRHSIRRIPSLATRHCDGRSRWCCCWNVWSSHRLLTHTHTHTLSLVGLEVYLLVWIFLLFFYYNFFWYVWW